MGNHSWLEDPVIVSTFMQSHANLAATEAANIIHQWTVTEVNRFHDQVILEQELAVFYSKCYI